MEMLKLSDRGFRNLVACAENVVIEGDAIVLWPLTKELALFYRATYTITPSPHYYVPQRPLHAQPSPPYHFHFPAYDEQSQHA
jgi:hypothetical protein